MYLIAPVQEALPKAPKLSRDEPLTREYFQALREFTKLLPGDDGEPMENERERIQINLCIDSFYQQWADRTDFFVGGNMFVYYTPAQGEQVIYEIADADAPRRAYRGPDFFVVRNVDGSYRRQTWVVWDEHGRYPDLICEMLSPSTRRFDLGAKKELYEQTFRTQEYFVFDYMHPTVRGALRGWRLLGGHYQPIAPDERGWLWSEQVELWLGKWTGVYQRDMTTWLRFYTPEGELVLTPDEAAARRADAEAVARRAAEENAAAEAVARRAAEEEVQLLRAELARLRGPSNA